MFAFIQPNQLPFLKQLRLVFTNVDQLDDPFIVNKRVHRPVSNQPLSDSEFSAAMEKNYHALEAHIKAMVSFDYYLQQAKQNRDQIEQQLQQQDTQSQLKAVMATKEQYGKVAFLRLFKTLHQQGLWESMGGNHHAVAVKLNTDHEYFQQASFNGKPQLFQTIEYDDARPASPTKENPFPALLRRPEHFAFEQEWRLIRPITAIDINKDQVTTCKLPKGLIQGMYLGLNCSAEIVDAMKALVSNDLQFRGVPLKQIGVSETHLRLVATSI